VAYGWSGYEPNSHIPGADITTAYRVGRTGQSLARERRIDPDDRFSLGRPLGELVIASAVVLYEAEAKQISLEVWGSNKRATRLYQEIGFALVTGVPDRRKTSLPVGSELDGQVVRAEIIDGKPVNVVDDVREFYLLSEHKLLK
jgi:hypothetical protein